MRKNASAIAVNQIDESPLSTKEKVICWILCILNPVMAGAIFYYGWKKKLPKKAEQANKISWMALGTIIAIGIVLSLLEQ